MIVFILGSAMKLVEIAFKYCVLDRWTDLDRFGT